MLKQRESSPVYVDGTNALHWIGIGGLGSGYANLPSFYYIPSKESMQTTTGQRKRFNHCEHTKVNEVYFDHTFVYKTDPSPSSPSSYYSQNNRLLHQPGADNPPTSTPDILDTWYEEAFPGINLEGVSWRENAERAVQAMWPKVEKGMGESLANSGYELPSLISIVGLNGRLRALAKVSTLSTGNTLKVLLAKGTRSSKTSLALQGLLGPKLSAYQRLVSSSARMSLIYEWAIRPLLSDCSQILGAFRTAETRIRHLLENEKRVFYSHWSCPLEGVPHSGTDSSRVRQVGNYSSEWMKYHLGLVTRKALYTATMKYSYRITSFERKHAMLLGKLRVLGLSNDPRMLWDAIPFSFLVDYFARMGDFISQSGDRGIDPVVNIHDFCHSIAWDYVRDLHIEVSTSPRVSYVKQLVHAKESSYYMREPFRPGQVAQLKLSGFTKYKVRMMATLLAAKTLH